MRNTIVSALGVLLIAGSAALITSASAWTVHRTAASEQFRDSYNSVGGNGAASAAAKREILTIPIPTTRRGRPGARLVRGQPNHCP